MNDASLNNDRSAHRNPNNSDQPELVVGKLIVRCSRHVDRITHSILVRDDDRETLILRACEGDSIQIWPPSPPLQEIVPHALGDHQAALLAVGKSGRGHWSASMHVSIDRPDSIDFDIACRSPDAVEWLGSTYQLDSEVRIMESNATATSRAVLHLRHANGTLLTLKALDGGEWKALENECEVRFEAHLAAKRFPSTFRWRYSVTMT